MIFGKSENNGEAAQRWRQVELFLFLYCVLCSLCFLVAVTHRSHRAYNIRIETYLHCESFLFLLRSRVQTLWMLTGYASLVVM